MMYVMGGRGRLGRAIVESRSPREVVALDRAVYEDWSQSDAAGPIGRFFNAAEPGSVVLVAAALIDPTLPRAEHLRVNYELPARVIEGACAAGLRVLTFGTVMERLLGHPNAYISTKARLGRLVAERAAAGDAVMHLQLHTLYGGGEPAPFMFLGQMLQALRAGRPFEMTAGRQLREYHHVDDDVAAMDAVLGSGVSGIHVLSHGAPCTLRELATHVFASVGRSDLLRLGARPEPLEENYETMMTRPPILQSMHFRSALDGVATYVRALLSGPKQA